MMMEQELNKVLGERFGKTLEEACMEEIYHALLTIVKGRMKDLKTEYGQQEALLYFGRIFNWKAAFQQLDQPRPV